MLESHCAESSNSAGNLSEFPIGMRTPYSLNHNGVLKPNRHMPLQKLMRIIIGDWPTMQRCRSIVAQLAFKKLRAI